MISTKKITLRSLKYPTLYSLHMVSRDKDKYMSSTSTPMKTTPTRIPLLFNAQ